jgi:hypothetical protein
MFIPKIKTEKEDSVTWSELLESTSMVKKNY